MATITVSPALRLEVLKQAAHDFYHYSGRPVSIYEAGEMARAFFPAIPASAFENLPARDARSQALEVLLRYPTIR